MQEVKIDDYLTVRCQYEGSDIIKMPTLEELQNEILYQILEGKTEGKVFGYTWNITNNDYTK